MKVIALDDQNFNAEVAQGVVLVDFWAPWCPPCRMIAPVIEELAADYEGRAKIAKVNIDDNQVAAAQFAVRSIPTLLIFKDGKLVDTLVGGQHTKQTLSAAINKHL